MVSFDQAIDVLEYLDPQGRSPYGRWFHRLDAVAAAKIAVAIEKIANGHFSNVEPVGEGVSEYKLDWGPGYRIYFGRDGETIVILLGGGTKKGQQSDIQSAKQAWSNYKRRKREALKKTQAEFERQLKASKTTKARKKAAKEQ